MVESTLELKEVGAGIQITPQTVKVFHEWGIADRLRKLATVPKGLLYFRYDDGSTVLREDDWNGWMQRSFVSFTRFSLCIPSTSYQGGELWQFHRADLQQCLYEYATELGVTVTFGVVVESVGCAEGTVLLKSGERLTADLVGDSQR